VGGHAYRDERAARDDHAGEWTRAQYFFCTKTATEVQMKIIGIAGASQSILYATAGYAAVDDAKAEQLAAKYNCTACHAIDKKVVGPGYKDVAKKYAGDASAPAKLEHKVKAGGSGVWGAIPMPPNNVPDVDIKTMVQWVLSLK
jgi:cytochrome c